jgi:hypothetical protein
MNIKYVAFETNPVNPGNALSGFEGKNSISASSGGNYISEIEERLKARQETRR